MAREGRTKRVRRRGLEEMRAQVVRLIERGTHPEDVAAAFEVVRSTVYGWWAAYQDKGEDSFKVGTSSGRPPKLSLREVASLRKLIVGKEPHQLHFDFAL
jgi:transposase